MPMMYEDLRNAGRLNLRAQPAIVRETPVTALIGAGAGLGQPAGVAGHAARD
jgi:LDH2 family malate/lactate/ureidoglycolate dehydrogenase